MQPISKVSSRGQTVLPKKIREHLQLAVGGIVTYQIENDRVILRRLPSFDEDYYRSLDATLSEEWSSPEDEEAFRDL